MPLNDQGKYAMLYRDAQHQQRLESIEIDTEKLYSDRKEPVVATDMAIIPDAYSSDDPLIVKPITPHLISIYNRTQNITQVIQLEGSRILKQVRHQYTLHKQQKKFFGVRGDRSSC